MQDAIACKAAPDATERRDNRSGFMQSGAAKPASSNMERLEPTMKTKLLHDNNGLKTFALVFDKDEDVREPLLAFARENRISGAHISAIGAFSEVTLAYFDRQKKAYQEIPVHEQVEVVAFTGTLARHEGNCVLHAHVVVGKADGSTMGGHFLRGKVWPTLEMIVVGTPQALCRVRDEETGLPLIDLTA